MVVSRYLLMLRGIHEHLFRMKSIKESLFIIDHDVKLKHVRNKTMQSLGRAFSDNSICAFHLRFSICSYKF